MTFNLFGSPTKDDIRVGYIDPTLGYVDGVTVCEANEYAKDNPGTVFVFRDGNNNLRYLNINEVNDLNPQNLTQTQGECGGLQDYKECGPPRIQFFGGGGIGAAGNPVIGKDGSLLAVDLVSGGFGYQYPPIVAANDFCQNGNGSVLTAVLGETADETEVYEGEEDFEEYEICEDTDVGYGLLYDLNGKPIDKWEPQVYTKIGEDPIRREIEEFEKLIKNPFWTTRVAKPDRITAEGKQYPDSYDVTHPQWSEFMNKYAISPIKPSDTTGTDEAGKTFKMEWETNFPISGEYIFRGVGDNNAKLYIDNSLVGTLGNFDQNPSPLQKTIQKGNHIVRVDLLNIPITETVQPTPTQNQTQEEWKFIENVYNPPNTFHQYAKGTWYNGKKYRTGDWNDTNVNTNFIQVDPETRIVLGTYYPSSQEFAIAVYKKVVTTTNTSAQQTSPTQIVSPKSWNQNPMGVSMIIEAPLPPIPQEQLPVQTGLCPPNPIWSTRFPGSDQIWYPVRDERWNNFFNRYAISPVLPLDTPGSDGSGVIHRNSWTLEVPYRGYYMFQVQRDNTARIYVDGNLAFDVTTSGDQKWVKSGLVNRVKSQKVLLEKGTHTISIELENTPQQTKSTIDTKIFSTQDWRSQNSPTAPPPTQEEWKFIENVYNPPNTFHQYAKGTWYNGKKYRTGDWNNTNINNNYIEIDANTRIVLGTYYPSSQEFAIAVYKKTPVQVQQSTSTSITKNGVTYEGPELFVFESKEWGNFMNNYSVSPKVFNSISEPDNRVVGKYTLTWKNVDFPQNGMYKFNFQADSVGLLKIGGREIIRVTDFKGQPVQYTFNVTKGKYDVTIEVDNLGDPSYLQTIGANPFVFSTNPIAASLYISKDIVFSDSNKTSWKQNPIGISAILIPPPCAKKIGGKGVVEKVIVNDPGNGYLPSEPQGPGYPVTLVLDEVIVENPGINYSCGEDQIQITPGNGAELDYTCDSFGRIQSVKVLNPGYGFDRYPVIEIPSETGVNASFRPVFRVVRDPVTPEIPPERLIQVTDLVGLKQTGYVDGRAYYGAVYYDQGVRYAGFYKTAGTQIRVYDTLQESITAQVTTPPSAIQRSGTDISSNDPRLNIPGTPESTS